VDSLQIALNCPIPGAEIRYTINGSEPTDTSRLYTAPLLLKRTILLKARAFLAGWDESFAAQAQFTRATPLPATTSPPTALGRVSCRYYEGDWTKLPDFDSLEVIKEADVTSFSLPDFAHTERFSLSFSGYINIPVDGMYDFSTRSDDGSALYVEDQKVVDNDGIHGPWEESGAIALQAGWHPLRVVMFQRTGGVGLEVLITGPGLKKQPIPAGLLGR
jgi:hypothetical protein